MEINILLVDDSAFMRQILKEKIAEIDGLNVIATARNSQEAFQKIKQFNPDLITLDIEMPGDIEGHQSELRHTRDDDELPERQRNYD